VAQPRKPEHRGLPARWRFYHGAYRYQVPPGLEHMWDGRKQFTLGRTLAEAYKVWADRVGRVPTVTTLADALDRYALEVIPKKAPRTQLAHRQILLTLRKRFGHATVQAGAMGVKPHHVYEYVSKNADRLTAAHREVEVLSHVFTMCVQWGLIERHPFKGEVRFERELQPRAATRYVEDWEVLEALSLKPLRKKGSVLMCQAYIRVKLLTGLRQTDLLSLQPAVHFTDVGIDLTASKTQRTTGVRQVFTWTPELRAAVDMALEARPLDIARWLFCTQKGESYVADDGTASSFGHIWGRFVDRVVAETKLRARFKERDLRAKVASDAESLERARELLGHADARLTQRVYVRKPTPIRPARGIE
jgi:integrase